MIDCGMTKNDARAICERVTELSITLINTHGDIDYISGMGHLLRSILEWMTLTTVDCQNVSLIQNHCLFQMAR